MMIYSLFLCVCVNVWVFVSYLVDRRVEFTRYDRAFIALKLCRVYFAIKNGMLELNFCVLNLYALCASFFFAGCNSSSSTNTTLVPDVFVLSHFQCGKKNVWNWNLNQFNITSLKIWCTHTHKPRRFDWCIPKSLCVCLVWDYAYCALVWAHINSIA